MGDYSKNIDFSDVFSCLNFGKQLDSSHFCFSPSNEIEQWCNSSDICSQTKEKQQSGTQDKISSIGVNGILYDPIQKGANPTEPQFHENIITQYKNIRQGTKDDTVKLHINFKTIFVSYFKEMMKANELSPYQQKKILQYSKRPPSFKSFILLISKNTENSEQSSINQLCANLIQSSEIVKIILSSKCEITTKLQMIKFLQILRKNLNGNGTIVRWKAIQRKKQKCVHTVQLQQQTVHIVN